MFEEELSAAQMRITELETQLERQQAAIQARKVRGKRWDSSDALN